MILAVWLMPPKAPAVELALARLARVIDVESSGEIGSLALGGPGRCVGGASLAPRAGQRVGGSGHGVIGKPTPSNRPSWPDWLHARQRGLQDYPCAPDCGYQPP